MPLVRYFSPDSAFDPSCSLFQPGPHRVLELGSGQAFASLHLASQLSPVDFVILTDLPEVIPLCEGRIAEWRNGIERAAQVIAKPLAWGQDIAHLRSWLPLTHIVMCDLVRIES